jgi:Amt family ammonium transporter
MPLRINFKGNVGKKINFFVLSIVVLIVLIGSNSYSGMSSGIDAGDNAWMLVASAFVLLMTPGLSF